MVHVHVHVAGVCGLGGVINYIKGFYSLMALGKLSCPATHGSSEVLHDMYPGVG